VSPYPVYQGLAVSEGVGTGRVYHGGTPRGPQLASPEEVAEAFAAVAAERSELARRLREEGRDEQAEIVEIGGLIAADPALVDPAVAAVRDGADAAAAVERSAATQAAALAALANPDLAARADDVRQVASAVLTRLAGGGAAPPPAGDFILVQREADPADLIRLAECGLVGAVAVAGGANSHAAIIARGLGLPMLAGADPAVLEIPAGRPALLDTAAGRLVVDPSARELAAVARASAGWALPANGSVGHDQGSAPAPRSAAAALGSAKPGHGSATPIRRGDGATGAPPGAHYTADGQEITLLCNAASAVETRMGLAAGAAGVGLLRTEIPFLGATSWPSESDHRSALAPVLDLLAGRPAVVRLLDFSGDKIPPFLAAGEAGLTALLRHPRALNDQLRAVLASGRDTLLRVMVPMVTTLDEVAAVRAALADAAAATGTDVPALGIMVEVGSTAAGADAFAPAVDFFSIGTNDLTSEVFGLARTDPRLRPDLAADPRVLALVAAVVAAADTAGVPVSVCGDAAGDPVVLPLLVGLGVRSVSVGAARLPQVAGWIAGADTAACAGLTARALQAAVADPVRAQADAR
jgi:phosphoenolpyruvate-protein kinase (PTS system EI component)